MKLLACLILAALVTVPSTPGQAADPWATATPMTVMLLDNRFEPDHLVLHKGQAYDLRLENRGKDLHEFTAPTFLKSATIRDPRLLSNGGGDVVVQSGTSAQIFLIPRTKGKFDLTCADHDWDGMTGDITVD